MSMTDGIEFIPPLYFVAGEILDFGGDLDHPRDALTKAVKEVVIPAFRENFEVGGRPAWEPLDAKTIEQGGRLPLMRTGNLYTNAQNISGWSISDNEAQYNGAPGAAYGLYHQEGTSKMPTRPWATVQESDEDQIVEVMFDWVAERLGDHGFDTFSNSI